MLEEAKRIRVQKAWYELKFWLKGDFSSKPYYMDSATTKNVLGKMKELEKVKV